MARRRARWFNESRARARAHFKAEADLCDAFVAKARAEGLVVHAETSGWDLLVVDPIGGMQVGVQAKLRANCDVLAQAIGYPEARVGPDLHAVLVVDAVPAFRQVAARLRVTVFDHVDLDPLLADPLITLAKRLEGAPLWSHEEREWVPPIEIECVTGGLSGPRQLTPWKIAALELCRVLAGGVGCRAPISPGSRFRRPIGPMPVTRYCVAKSSGRSLATTLPRVPRRCPTSVGPTSQRLSKRTSRNQMSGGATMHSGNEFQDLISDGVDVCCALWATTFEAVVNAVLFSFGATALTTLVGAAIGGVIGAEVFGVIARVLEAIGVRA